MVLLALRVALTGAADEPDTSMMTVLANSLRSRDESRPGWSRTSGEVVECASRGGDRFSTVMSRERYGTTTTLPKDSFDSMRRCASPISSSL